MRARREKVRYTLDKTRVRLNARKPRPVRARKRLGNIRARIWRSVYAHGDDKRPIASNHVGTLVSEVPFQPKVPFVPRCRVRRDDRYEQGAVPDLLADHLVPGIPTTKFTLIEPDLNACCSERVTDPPSSL
jgi:hypothetical protein